VQQLLQWKIESITHSEGVFAALGTQREMCIRLIVIRGFSGSARIFHIISRSARFWKSSWWT